MTCCYFIRCIYVQHNIANLHESTGLCCKQTFLAGSIWQKRYTRLLGIIIIITTMPNIQHRLHLWKRTTCSPLFYSIKQQTGFVLLLIYSSPGPFYPDNPRRDPSNRGRSEYRVHRSRNRIRDLVPSQVTIQFLHCWQCWVSQILHPIYYLSALYANYDWLPIIDMINIESPKHICLLCMWSASEV